MATKMTPKTAQAVARRNDAKRQQETRHTSLVTLGVVTIVAVSMAAGAIMATVFQRTLNGDYNKQDQKLMSQYGSLNLDKAVQSGGLVINK